MGLLDVSVLLLLSPVIMTAGIAHKVLSTVIPQPKSKARGRDQPQELYQRPPPDRGRLIVFAVDETSLAAIQWAVHNLMTPADYVHLVHVLEGEEQLAGTLPQTFARHSIETVKRSCAFNGIKLRLIPLRRLWE